MAEKRNWTGKVFYISRDFWAVGGDRYRKELEFPGVYILSGKDESIEGNDDDLQTIYIGHAENLFARIGQHTQDPEKSFYTNVVCVTGSGNFNNAHFRWMEAYLIEKAQEIERCELQNGNTPNKPRISESDEVDTRYFLEEALQMFPIVEVNAFALPKTIGSKKKEKRNGEKKPLKENLSEVRNNILASFQERENTNLLKRSAATFYNESKKIRVCCSFSKKYDHITNENLYWFGPSPAWIEFLKGGEKGYLVLGMEEQSKAIALPVKKFDTIKDKLTVSKNKEGGVGWWHIYILEDRKNFRLRLKRGEEPFDISSYIFDIG